MRIMMNREHHEEVKSFEYCGAIVSAEGSSTNALKARINLATLVMARLKQTSGETATSPKQPSSTCSRT